MTRLSKFLFTAISLGALGGTALAQDDGGEGGGEAGGEAGAEAGATVEAGAGVDAGAAGAEAGAAVDAGAEVTAGVGMWPKAAIERPFFRAKGKITVGGDFNLLAASFSDGMGGSGSLTLDFITLGGAYAITDQISAGALYGISLGLADGDFAADGPLALWAGYQIKHDTKLSVAATGSFAIDLSETENKGIGIGLGLRYAVAPKVAVFTGGPHGPGPLGGAGLGGGPLSGLFGPGGHLNISLAESGPITFDIPVGGMFQATPELAIHALTTLASIGISNSPYVNDMGEEKAAIIFGADYIPLSVGALYAASDMLDVMVNLNLPDLKEAQFDLYIVSVGARAHL